ncbi:uncharacterized protein Bfra_002723ia [Botrytis fragariae]|uniref:Uncharacterized protein n=1 Tax=Botrytis fragariae TaxID=1964551 RepID=A0A8H6AZ99_9HELO|nr:uncharacterized protein Bfra_002723ia [Botrytis fragariae]KAF5876319.1 hypothetical protein Bfra_002723ia [Botrytis fragariae]
MAGANSEGIAWFPRAALKCWGFDPDDAKQFYSHILLEIVSNSYVDEGFGAPDIPCRDINRLGKQILSKPVRKTYVRYRYMNAMAGSTCMGTKRQDSVGGTDAYFQISDQSGKNEVGLWPCLIPTLDEQFLWVDLSYPLRCIYIPLCQEAHKRYPGLCTYTRVAMHLYSPTLKIYRYIKLDEEELIRGNYNLLNREKDYAKQIDTLNRGSVGQKMREREGHTLKSELTKLAHRMEHRNPITKLPITKEPGVFGAEKRREQGIFGDDFEVMNQAGLVQLDRLIISQYGISVTYQGNGYDKDWIVKCLMGIVAVGLSRILMIGPLVALGSQLITDAILDPEFFTTAQELVAKIPDITQPSHVLALEGDDKQGRSIQVGPDASNRGGGSGQSDKKVDTLINNDTFENFNDEPEKSGEEENDGKEGSEIDGDNTSEDGAKHDPENEAEEGDENNQEEEGTRSNEEGEEGEEGGSEVQVGSDGENGKSQDEEEAEGSEAQVGSDNGDNEKSQDEGGSGANAVVDQDDANSKDSQEGDEISKNEASEEDLKSEDDGGENDDNNEEENEGKNQEAEDEG